MKRQTINHVAYSLGLCLVIASAAQAQNSPQQVVTGSKQMQQALTPKQSAYATMLEVEGARVMDVDGAELIALNKVTVAKYNDRLNALLQRGALSGKRGGPERTVAMALLGLSHLYRDETDADLLNQHLQTIKNNRNVIWHLGVPTRVTIEEAVDGVENQETALELLIQRALDKLEQDPLMRMGRR